MSFLCSLNRRAPTFTPHVTRCFIATPCGYAFDGLKLYDPRADVAAGSSCQATCFRARYRRRLAIYLSWCKCTADTITVHICTGEATTVLSHPDLCGPRRDGEDLLALHHRGRWISMCSNLFNGTIPASLSQRAFTP